MTLTDFSLRRPVTTAMVTMSVVVLGLVSLRQLPLQLYPNVSSSGVNVKTKLPNASAEEIEQKVTVPLETALGTLSNIERITSTSNSRSEASVRVEFKAGTDMDVATMQTRERADLARASMPPETDYIRVQRWQTGQEPIINARLAWRGDNDRLLDVIYNVIEPHIRRLPGVGNVVVGSVDLPQLSIDLDREQLQSHGLTRATLDRQLRENNVNMSVGRIREGDTRYLVRLVSEFQEPEAIGDLPLKGGRLRLSDIGDVVYGLPAKTRYERLDGRESAEIMVYKTDQANIVEVGEAIVAALERFEEEYAGKIDFAVVSNRAARVSREVNTLVNTASFGALLAMAVIFVFMRSIRATVIVGIAIPMSALCVFVGLYVAREVFGSEVSLNMVTMIGLMLAVGMLVDPAVVALDSIFRHRHEGGKKADEAALVGGREVGLAVLASCLTTTCVFVPFFFFSNSGSALWMRDAGMAICLAVLMSMVVALALLPLAASRLFRDGIERYDRYIVLAIVAAIGGLVWYKLETVGGRTISLWWARWLRLIGDSIKGMEWTSALGFAIAALALVTILVVAGRHGLRSSYARLLGWTLDHRWVVLAATVGLSGTGYYLYQGIEHQGSPWQRERRVTTTTLVDRSYNLEDSKAFFAEIEKRLLKNKAEFDIEYLVTDIQQRVCRMHVYLVDADDGRLTTPEAASAIMAVLPEKVGYTHKTGWSWRNTHGVEVELYGRDPDVLAVFMDEIADQLQRMPGVKGVTTSLEDGREEIQVNVDGDRVFSHGLSTGEVASGIAAAFGTRRASGFNGDNREIDIVVQLNEGDRESIDQLRSSTFRGRDGQPIQLASLADFRLRPAPWSLNRVDRQLKVTLFANTATQEQATQLAAEPVGKMVNSINLPPGYSWKLGTNERWWEREDDEDTTLTTLFAVLLIYLIMASLFESLVYPFTIMLAIPFSLIGVALGLSALDIPFDDNGTLGLLILFGIVVNNGIVLIDHINRLRAQGLSRREAILLGGQHRLRPILMTAATTILNLLPLVIPMIYGTAEGFSKRWGPTGLVVVSGLTTSTLLTLVLAPTLYCLMDDLGVWLKQALRVSYLPRRAP